MSEFKREPLAEGLECTGPTPDQASDQACPPRGVPPVAGPALHGQRYAPRLDATARHGSQYQAPSFPAPDRWRCIDCKTVYATVAAPESCTCGGRHFAEIDQPGKYDWNLDAGCDEVVAVKFPGVTSREQAARLRPFPGRGDEVAAIGFASIRRGCEQATGPTPYNRHPVDVLAEQSGSGADPRELARLRLICDEQTGSDGAGTGMWDFPQALDGSLLTLVTAFCVNIAETRPTNQDIGRRGSPYIDRWFLARKTHVPLRSEAPEFADLPPFMAAEIENLYLHRYHRGDADEPHDHPWPNASLVVQGWYREAIYDENAKLLGTAVRYAGDIVLRRATSVHAVLETSGDCLSLFATLRKERDWGFHTANGFVPWQEFDRQTKGTDDDA